MATEQEQRAEPQGIVDRAKVWAKRHPAWVIGIGVVAALALIGSFIPDPKEGQSLEAPAALSGTSAKRSTGSEAPISGSAATGLSPELTVKSWRCYQESFSTFGGYAYIEGEVTNVSGQTLKNVAAVARWYTGSGQFITSDDALITFNPLLPNQTSPFKTITTLNPEMTNCRLSFKLLLGRELRTQSEASSSEK